MQLTNVDIWQHFGESRAGNAIEEDDEEEEEGE